VAGVFFDERSYHEPGKHVEENQIMKTLKLVVFVILLLSVAACSGGAPAQATPEVIPIVVADDIIISEGRVEPVNYAEVAFTGSGVVSEVLVEAGDTVKKGQPLVRTGGASDAAYAAAHLELVNSQQALDELLDTEAEARAQALIDIDQAEEDLDKAQDYYESLFRPYKYYKIAYKYIYLPGKTKRIPVLRKVKVEKGDDEVIADAEADLALKLAQLESAQRAYDRMKDGPDSVQLALLEARLNAAKAGVAAFELVAPFDGVVTKIDAKVGGSINAGQVAVTVADFSEWLIKTTDLTEIDVVALTEGQPALVTLDAIPDLALNGEVVSIGQNFSENQGDVVYETTILLTDTNPAMRWGMTAEVTFETSAR
jgi:multidrug resistance efflux pump